MTIRAYRKRTVSNSLVVYKITAEDEHAFFFEGDTYAEAEEAVEKETELFGSGPVLFLVTK